MIKIFQFVLLTICSKPENPSSAAHTKARDPVIDQAVLQEVVNDSLGEQTMQIQALLNLFRNEIITTLTQQITDVKGMLINSTLSNLQKQGLNTNGNLNGVYDSNTNGSLIFPGTDQEYNALLRIIMKSSSCGGCVTCKKGGMCMLNTYKILSEIVDKYPSWQPPDNIPLDAKINPLLSDVLKDIAANKDNNDPMFLMWLTNNKLKHLLNPILQLSMKMPSTKSNGSFNPALLLLAQGQNTIDPAMMMMLSQGKVDPMVLAMQQGGNIDPMLMALMNSKDGKQDQSALLFAMMNKNNNNNGGNNGTPANGNCDQVNSQKVADNGQNNFASNINPAMLPLLFGSDVDPVLLYSILNNNKTPTNVSDVAKTLGRYGKQLEELKKTEDRNGGVNPVVMNYGSRYGKQ